jgi:GT2 family glycosyltransferase
MLNVGTGPRVSVVINNWNRKGDLRDAITSVRKQTYKNIEIIVSDNHSTDGSIETVRGEFPEVKLIVMPNSNYGGVETCNIGLASATGEYVVMMDNDALLEKNWIEEAIKEFENDNRLAVLATRVLNYYTNEDWGFPIYGLNGDWKDKEFYTTVFVGCSAMMRKDILDKVGYFPGEYFLYHNEFALGAEIVNAGYRIKYNPNLIAYHKVSQMQRPGKRGYYYLTRNWYWYVWEYYPGNLAVKSTLAHFVVSCYGGVKFPLTFLRAHVDAIRGLPRILRSREPIKDRELLKQPEWQLQLRLQIIRKVVKMLTRASGRTRKT